MNKINNFYRDNAWQRSIRDLYLTPFYGKYSYNGRFIYVDKGSLARTLQLLACDTLVQGRDGATVIGIEEKIVRHHWDNFFLETHSCTVPGHETPGWIYYGRADYLLYCFLNKHKLLCYLIPFPPLQEWFRKTRSRYRWPFHIMKTTPNRSRGDLVSITETETEMRRRGCPVRLFYLPNEAIIRSRTYQKDPFLARAFNTLPLGGQLDWITAIQWTDETN